MSTKKPTSWETFDPEDQFAGTSLKKRAEKRTLQQTSPNSWIVHGQPKMGDAYPSYNVKLPEGEHKYECSCYSHGRGEYRRRKMCSHVLAVILHKKKNKQKAKDDEPQTVPNKQVPHADTEPKDPEKAAVKNVRRAAGRGGAARRRPKVEAVEVEPSDRFKSSTANTYPEEPMAMDDDAMGSPPMPEKFVEYRDNQWDAIVEIMEHLEQGKKVVMLSAPTGSGKTLIGETVRRLMVGRSTYCCTTKSLQDQIQREFYYAKTIKGRINYPTEHRADLTANDCTGTQKNQYRCSWCDDRMSCPYVITKDQAVHAPFPILNIAYFLAETTNQQSSQFWGRELVIIDEADTLEEQLMSSIEVVIGSYLRKSIGVKTLPKKSVANDWARWLEDEVIPKIRMRQAQLRVESATLFGEDITAKRQVATLEKLANRIRPLLKFTENGTRRIEEGWVMTGYEGNAKDPTIRFKPIKVDEHAREGLWDRGRQFLLMSATLISPQQMAEDLGLEEDEWAVVHLDSTFPIERRPVFSLGVTSMSNKTKAKAWPIMAEAIEKVIDENQGVRILVHTVSYHLTNYLRENMRTTRTMSYGSAQEREKVLKNFLDIKDAVLLAPSFERGIDLPEEDCQVIIIAKVPFPYLGDKQISARLFGFGAAGRMWYAVQTIRALVQMTGRGMRSKDDWADSYIMDRQFNRLYREHKRLFPKWWKDSLVMSMTDPKNRPLIKAARERKEGR